MVQYYTLEQAAQILQTTPDKLKEMAKKNEVRAFQDRGNLRFRAQEIDELARARGLGSDPALPLGEAAKGGPASPSPRKKSKIPPQEPLALVEDDEAPIGEPSSSSGRGGPASSGRGGPPSSGKSPRPASRLGPQSPSRLGPQSPSKLGPPSKTGRKPTQTAGPKSPPPSKASDSDVRLVAEGSDLDFQVVQDAPKSPAPGPGTPSGKSGGARKARPSKLNNAPDTADSGVRIVPLDDSGDSDVKITPEAGASDSAVAAPKSGQRPSDSDIRLDDSSKDVGAGKRSPVQNPITEEIDLDEEQARADAAARTQAGAKGRPKANPLNLPTSSPFELSENDIDMDEPAAGPKPPARPSSPADKSADTDSSSDFELTPIGEVDPTPLEPSSSEQPALPVAGDDSDEVGLGELTGAGAAQSGINLQDPADSGISLEQGGSDEFELALGSEGDSSSGEEGSSAGDSSSEFELALDSAEGAAEGAEESSSEFELSLDESGEAAATEEPGEDSSDSEFELTLDADGGLESSGETDALAGEEGEEKDIFETDFEVPALEDEESGSEAVAMEDEDTDLEASDFDLALDEDGASEEDSESGSQVVDLDDEEAEADEGAETEARPRRSRATAEDEEGELDLEIDPTAEPEEEEEEEALVGAGAAAVAPPAKWGPLPALLMLPSVIVLFVVGLLTFELAGTMWGYRQPGHTTGFGIVLHPIAKYFDNSLPD